MTKWMSALTLNQRLALLALTLGVVAIGARPMRGNVVTIDARDLARIVAAEVDHVGVDELADWIIAGRSDYRLVDLRGAAAFASYHIPTAENVPLPALPDYPFGRQEKIVLYSDGGIHSAQAWFLLRAKGYRGVYILRGGLDEWKDTVLFPRLAENPSPSDLAANEKRKYVSRHFGGNPLAGGVGQVEAAPVEMPKVEMPAASPTAQLAKKKKREGC
jgi:rhodanese-related sulfurtransferase